MKPEKFHSNCDKSLANIYWRE